jgi:hypothetical protein
VFHNRNVVLDGIIHIRPVEQEGLHIHSREGLHIQRREGQEATN